MPITSFRSAVEGYGGKARMSQAPTSWDLLVAAGEQEDVCLFFAGSDAGTGDVKESHPKGHGSCRLEKDLRRRWHC